jgi:lipopolysaccharide export system permease protein
MEMVRRSYGKDISWKIISKMTLLKLPYSLQEIAVFTILFGALLTFSRLGKSNEVVAVRASGLSIWQILLPVFGLTCALSLFMLTVFNPLATTMLQKSYLLENKYLKKESYDTMSVSKLGLWIKEDFPDGKQHILRTTKINPKEGMLYDVISLVVDSDYKFIRRVDAKYATIEDNKLLFNNAVVTTNYEMPTEFSTYEVTTNIDMNKVQNTTTVPKYISFWDLPPFIKLLDSAGLSSAKYRIYWHKLLAMPVYCIVMTILATMTMRPNRVSSRTLHMAKCLILGFVIYSVAEISSSMGFSKSNAVFAVWGIALIQFLLVVALVLHMEES